jgi:hypothetical protein
MATIAELVQMSENVCDGTFCAIEDTIRIMIQAS